MYFLYSSKFTPLVSRFYSYLYFSSMQSFMQYCIFFFQVESLIGRIERLGFTAMHPNVGVTLDSWLAAIKDLRNNRKNEVPGMQYGSKGRSEAGIFLVYIYLVFFVMLLK